MTDYNAVQQSQSDKTKVPIKPKHEQLTEPGELSAFLDQMTKSHLVKVKQELNSS
jgi:hypothetical protein